ncbi:MAG: 4Fe-4S dicluster domain-containing protein [Clostridia bacterium]|nr:4Fe-4S dicluster domain-containing protein [Clostridia bacterium]
MAVYKHSVSLEEDKCKGCTTCLKHCPTESIRIRDGRAVINSDVCIDCGECIRVCPHKAKKAIFDKLEDISPWYKWRIALPPPSLYGQFENLDDVDYVLQGLLDCGFNEVFEVARAAEIVTDYTRRYMRKKDIPRPVISSACPTIVRLIRLRFPYLCDNVIPMLPPVEVASRMAKEEALKKHPELKEDEICTVFISPCPAKASYVKNGISQNRSSIDYVVSMSEMYFKLIGAMKAEHTPAVSSETGTIGISWASSGGEASALFNDRYLAADGIDNAIKVLDQIETGNFPKLEFVELNACPGGCVGGAVTVENPYIAKVRLQSLRRYLPVSRNRVDDTGEPSDVPDEIMLGSPITYAPAMRLNANRGIAMQMMSDIEKIDQLLPEIDCGSCGAPTCRAFAEDVVKGEAKVEECVVYMRERLHELLNKQKEGKS